MQGFLLYFFPRHLFRSHDKIVGCNLGKYCDETTSLRFSFRVSFIMLERLLKTTCTQFSPWWERKWWWERNDGNENWHDLPVRTGSPRDPLGAEKQQNIFCSCFKARYDSWMLLCYSREIIMKQGPVNIHSFRLLWLLIRGSSCFALALTFSLFFLKFHSWIISCILWRMSILRRLVFCKCLLLSAALYTSWIEEIQQNFLKSSIFKIQWKAGFWYTVDVPVKSTCHQGA